MNKQTKIAIGLIIIAGGFYLYNRNKDKKKLGTSLIALPETEILNSEYEEYFLTHDRSPHILEFKDNLKRLKISYKNPVILQLPDNNFIQGRKPPQKMPPETVITDIADEDFMHWVAQQIQDPVIADGEKLSVDFVKDFNIIIGNLIKPDFKYTDNLPKQNYTEAEVIKKGDKSRECNELNEILNTVFGKKILNTHGNYTNVLYDITADIFKGTSVFNNENKDGQISKQFINNLYNLLIQKQEQ